MLIDDQLFQAQATRKKCRSPRPNWPRRSRMTSTGRQVPADDQEELASQVKERDRQEVKEYVAERSIDPFLKRMLGRPS